MSDDVDDALAAAREGPEAFSAWLDGHDAGDVARGLRSRAEADPAVVGPALDGLAPLVAVDDRSARLAATKAFLAVAEADPTAVPPDPLRDALDDEFYYVRSRAAEALGRRVRACGDADPTLIARLLNGLTLEREETRERYAGALADVALGDPNALRTVTDEVAAGLDDPNALVRYHLATALAATGTAAPDRLPTEPLRARLDDESPVVRGRAVQALALAGDRVDPDVPEPLAGATVEGVETLAGTHADAVAAVTEPDGATCPGCGEPLPEAAPPFCPACGGPIN